MGDKDVGRYHYEPYPAVVTTKQNNGTNTLKRGDCSGSDVKMIPPHSSTLNSQNSNKLHSRSRCCSCMTSKSASFWAGLLTNLGICTLLFAYTLLGK